MCIAFVICHLATLSHVANDFATQAANAPEGMILTHGGRVTHICVSELTIIGSDNGLPPGRRQAIIRTNAGILLIRASKANFSEVLSNIHTVSFKRIHFKMSSGKPAANLSRPQCVNLVRPEYSSIACNALFPDQLVASISHKEKIIYVATIQFSEKTGIFILRH